MTKIIPATSGTSNVVSNNASVDNSSFYDYIQQGITYSTNPNDVQAPIYILGILAQFENGGPSKFSKDANQFAIDAESLQPVSTLNADLATIRNDQQPTFTPDQIKNAYKAVLQEGIQFLENNPGLTRLPYAFLDSISPLFGTSFDPNSVAFKNAINDPNSSFSQALNNYMNAPTGDNVSNLVAQINHLITLL